MMAEMKYINKYLLLLPFIIFLGCNEEDKTLVTQFKAPQVFVDTPSISYNTVEVVLSGSYLRTSSSNAEVLQCGFDYHYDEDENFSFHIYVPDDDIIKVGQNGAKFSKSEVIDHYGSVCHLKAFIVGVPGIIYSEETTFKIGDFCDYVSLNNPTVTPVGYDGASIRFGCKVAKGIKPSGISLFYKVGQGTTNSVQGELLNDSVIQFNIKNLSIGDSFSYWAVVNGGADSVKSTTYEFTFFAQPSISTIAVTEITSESAKTGGCNISENGHSIITKGIIWSESSGATIENNLGIAYIEANAEDFEYTITGLSPGTKYYVRAFASNSAGTSYGSEVSFTTDIVIPVVSTSEITSITSSSFSGGGNISYNGGGTITSRGIVWDTNENPTIALTTKTTDGNGDGSFSSTATELQPNTVYYVRAYATNAKGTAYGEQITVKTLAKGENEDIGNEPYTW